MNVDRLMKIANLLIMAAIVVLLAYAWLVAIPEQTILFKACEEKVLCQQKILKGRVCDKYEFNYSIPNLTIVPSDIG